MNKFKRICLKKEEKDFQHGFEVVRISLGGVNSDSQRKMLDADGYCTYRGSEEDCIQLIESALLNLKGKFLKKKGTSLN